MINEYIYLLLLCTVLSIASYAVSALVISFSQCTERTRYKTTGFEILSL